MFEVYKGKRVFVTGHTGFKGSWLCEMLLMAGARVYGYALKPTTSPSLFNELKLGSRITKHQIGDIRDFRKLSEAVGNADPDFVFHLAAQPIVRESYVTPRETFDINVQGTVNLLESIRTLTLAKKRTRPIRVVCITTDKVYENDNSGRAFKEGDPLGGSDPYSASKGACEIAIASYARSFFGDRGSVVSVASARAGNVIGGGDWAPDRIVPDIVRAWRTHTPLVIRNRLSTRPWQHVLEPLSGYLALGASGRSGAFNFGPSVRQVKTVDELVKRICKYLDGLEVRYHSDPRAPSEAKLLRLDSGKAARVLGWKPCWKFSRTIEMTSLWYARVQGGESAADVTREQIRAYLGEMK